MSPDGQHVADFAYIPSSTGLAQSGQVQVFNTRTGSLSGTYPVAGSEALAWSRDGRYLAAASQGLEVVDLATGTEEAFVVAGAEQCGIDGAPAFSADDSLVAWATRCGSVGVFRLSGAPVSSFSVAGQPSGLAFNSSGSSLAVSNWDGAVDVFDPRTGTEVLSLPTAPSSVTAVAFSNDDRYIVTTLDNQSVEVFGAASGELDRIDLDPSRLLAGPAFDAGGSDFATADASGTVKIWSECPACGDAPMLERLARSQVVTELTPMEQAAEK